MANAVVRSRDNARVKRWRKLLRDPRARRAEGRAVIEGEHLVAEALARGWKVDAVVVRESAAALAPSQAVVLSDAVFDSLSDLDAPASIAAEIRLPGQDLDLSGVSDGVVLEGVQDAGNVGTIVRSAAAFGIQWVLIDGGSADPWSPKVLRAAQGGHFHTRVARTEKLVADLAAYPGALLGTVASGGRPPAQLDLRGPVAWVFGSEGAGMSSELERKCSALATIPLPGGMESLNVAAAAAICLYETLRQRNQAGRR